MTVSDILILGTGLAGYVTAMEFRKQNTQASVSMLTAGQGHFYSKPTVSTAYAHARSPQDLITQTAEQMMSQYQLNVMTEQTVVEIDSQQKCVRTLTGQTHYYQQHLVLACGAQPRVLKCSGDAIDSVFSLNQWEDYFQLRAALNGSKHVLVIGCGLVGAELCCDLRSGGHQVTCVHDADWPIHTLLPEPMGQALKTALCETGVRWVGSDLVTSVMHDASGFKATLESGRVLNADVVISAIGMEAQIDLAQRAGLVTQKGIVTDAYLQTSDPNIYAVGDCAEVSGWLLFHITPLRRCAQALALSLAGHPTAVSYPAMPVVVKTPCCPIVVCPSLLNVQGHWKIEGQGQDWLGRFESETGDLLGFAVTGQCVRDRAGLHQALVPWMPSEQ